MCPIGDLETSHGVGESQDSSLILDSSEKSRRSDYECEHCSASFKDGRGLHNHFRSKHCDSNIWYALLVGNVYLHKTQPLVTVCF